MALTVPPTVPSTASSTPSMHPSLPQRPTYDFAANADSIGLGAAPTLESVQNAPTAAQALAGSNRDVVANRRAIRMANMSAAEVLKAELSGLSPVKAPTTSKPPRAPTPPQPMDLNLSDAQDDASMSIPGLGSHSRTNGAAAALHPFPPPMVPSLRSETPGESDADADGDPDPDTKMDSVEPEGSKEVDSNVHAGVKRTFEEGPGSDDVVNDAVIVEEEDDDAPPSMNMALKVNADGTVEQEDTVK
jgi:5'-3' exoribonuclease 2